MNVKKIKAKQPFTYGLVWKPNSALGPRPPPIKKRKAKAKQLPSRNSSKPYELSCNISVNLPQAERLCPLPRKWLLPKFSWLVGFQFNIYIHTRILLLALNKLYHLLLSGFSILTQCSLFNLVFRWRRSPASLSQLLLHSPEARYISLFVCVLFLLFSHSVTLASIKAYFGR